MNVMEAPQERPDVVDAMPVIKRKDRGAGTSQSPRESPAIAPSRVSPHPRCDTASSSPEATGRTVMKAVVIATAPNTELTTKRRPSDCLCLRNGNARSSTNSMTIPRRPTEGPGDSTEKRRIYLAIRANVSSVEVSRQRRQSEPEPRGSTPRGRGSPSVKSIVQSSSELVQPPAPDASIRPKGHRPRHLGQPQRTIRSSVGVWRHCRCQMRVPKARR